MIDFNHFRSEYPEYESAWINLQQWLESHWDQGLVNLGKLAQELDKVPAFDLVMALETLVEHNKMQTFYKLVDCKGVPTNEEYSEPDKIPLTEQTANCEILVYFRWIF